MSSILNEIYASANKDRVLIPTIEVRERGSSDVVLTCGGYSDTTAALEDGTEVEFKASMLSVSLPPKNNSGEQQLRFAIENVTGISWTATKSALENGSPIDVVYRVYAWPDLSAPAAPPIRMKLARANFKGPTTQITARLRSALSYAWPRRRYNAQEMRGLKHVGKS